MATKTENGAAAAEDSKPPSFYDDEDHLKKLCDFLRTNEGPPVREALLMEKRVHYLKGTLKSQMLFFELIFSLLTQ
jgi:hypothetical protein